MFRTGPKKILEYKLLGVGIPSRYSEYLLMVKSIRQKESEKTELELINLNWNWQNGIDHMSAHSTSSYVPFVILIKSHLRKYFFTKLSLLSLCSTSWVLSNKVDPTKIYDRPYELVVNLLVNCSLRIYTKYDMWFNCPDSYWFIYSIIVHDNLVCSLINSMKYFCLLVLLV